MSQNRQIWEWSVQQVVNSERKKVWEGAKKVVSIFHYFFCRSPTKQKNPDTFLIFPSPLSPREWKLQQC